MKVYAYLALAVVVVGAFTWYSMFLYKAGWDGHVAASAVEQGKLKKRLDDVKAKSAVALAKARKQTEIQRRKYRDADRALRAQNKKYEDWATAHIPDDAVPLIWLRGK